MNIKNTFAFPSHQKMFPLLALFAGKTSRIPRDINTHLEYEPDDLGDFHEVQKHIIKISNPRIEAEIKVNDGTLKNKLKYGKKKLANYIDEAFGPKGLRNLLGIIIGLEETDREGSFIWNVNEHLERLGYKRNHGSYKVSQKENATEILKIFATTKITAKYKGEKVMEEDKLINFINFNLEEYTNRYIKEDVKIKATKFWYENAFKSSQNSSQTYTKLPKKIAQENHRQSPFTIFLTCLLAVFWRIDTNRLRKLSIKNLMEWCDIDYNNKYQRKRIRRVQESLDYMKKQNYLKDWTTKAKKEELPSEWEEPLNCTVKLETPDWLAQQLSEIKEKRKEYLNSDSDEEVELITRDKFIKILEESDLTQEEFGNKINKSRQTVNAIANKRRGISKEVSQNVRELFVDNKKSL